MDEEAPEEEAVHAADMHQAEEAATDAFAPGQALSLVPDSGNEQEPEQAAPLVDTPAEAAAAAAEPQAQPAPGHACPGAGCSTAAQPKSASQPEPQHAAAAASGDAGECVAAESWILELGRSLAAAQVLPSDAIRNLPIWLLAELPHHALGYKDTSLIASSACAQYATCTVLERNTK